MDTLMPYVFDRLRTEATDLIAVTGLVAPESVLLTEPKANVPADLAFPVFASAKVAGVSPNDFAKRLAEAVALSPESLFSRVEPAGGFVNFSVRPDIFASAVLADVAARGDAYGEDKSVGKGETTIVEYSSPNIARKMHVGHLRSTVIGHSIYKILKALGYNVVGDNHLGDWGTQFGTLLAALDADKREPWNEPDPVQSLVEIYGEFNKAAKTDPALMDTARAWFNKLERGDPWARQTWQRLIDITMAEFERTYKRFDVVFDTQHGESFYEPMLDAVVDEAVAKGVAKVEEGGAVAVYFDDALPSCLLRKTDGATLYQTRDAATCLYRWQNYAPARNIYVVGAEQKLHFQQVFETVRRMGYTEIADRSVHISFGTVWALKRNENGNLHLDENGKPKRVKFSMREGNVVFLNQVLDEAIERSTVKVREQIASGNSEATEEEIQGIAEIVGIGTVIYADLYQGPERDIDFDWAKLLSNEGNTCVYLQYMYARCRSIQRKAPAGLPTADPSILTAPEEQTLLKQLARMPNAVRDAGEKFLPATVAEWTYTLAKEFSRFYDKCPVLTAETDELKAARLALVAATAQGLKNGLALLGIGVPERM